MRIAVVGAGIAGLTAGRRLAEAGHAVTVFDKARGVGGRTSTRRSDESAYDHGAQYFTCRGERFRELCEDLQSRGVVASWDAPVVEVSRGQVRTLADHPGRYVGVPGMSALAKALAAPLSVHCATRIAQLDSAHEGSRQLPVWRLRSEEGVSSEQVDAAAFEAVVVATPAPQALPLVEASANLTRHLRSVALEPCWAVMLRFEKRLDVAFGGAFVVNSKLAWVARNGSKPGRPAGEAWVLHASPAWSREHLELPAGAVARELTQAFGEALPGSLPPPVAQSAHRWLYARPLATEPSYPLWDRERRIGVCGDWTRGARVEDAFESGQEVAAEILSSEESTR